MPNSKKMLSSTGETWSGTLAFQVQGKTCPEEQNTRICILKFGWTDITSDTGLHLVKLWECTKIFSAQLKNKGKKGANSVITSKNRAALSVCVAISVSLIAPHQPADAKYKGTRHRAENVQIAALPFFRKDTAKDTAKDQDAKKKAADKTTAADAKKDKAQAAAAKDVKADKKKGTAEDVSAKKTDKSTTEPKAAAAPVKTETAAEKERRSRSSSNRRKSSSLCA